MPASKGVSRVTQRLRHLVYLSVVCVWIALLWLSSQFSRVGVSTGH